jgi:hypothetical protein
VVEPVTDHACVGTFMRAGEAREDLFDVVIGHGAGHALIVAVRVETELLVADAEPDVVRASAYGSTPRSAA